jgi:hypothetical protein
MSTSSLLARRISGLSSKRNMTSIQAKPFKLALVQLGGLSEDKAKNLEVAAAGVKTAVQEGKAGLVVLPVSHIRLVLLIKCNNLGNIQFSLCCNRIPQIL